MSGHGVVPMDSYRLAQYSVQVDCFICGEGNNFDAELCRHCQAPLALAHQANKLKRPPQMVATLGSADAGKTVYLGMLTDILSRRSEQLQLLARGAFSVSLQQHTTAALANCEFPDKTPNEPDRWNWIHCQIKATGRKQPVELIMPDLAGDAILEEVDHPHAYPVIRSFISKCTGMMVLVDAVRLQEGEKDQDFFAVKALTYLSELDDNEKTGWPSRPIAVVFTKADLCESCFENPAAYAQRHAPGLWQQCCERFKQCGFFAVGVAGTCAQVRELGGIRQVPLRVEPRGIIEPFAWLIGKLKS